MPTDHKKHRKKKKAKDNLSNLIVRDPIQALPPELWSQCISETALCDRGMSNILVLTTVSRRWNAAMVSTPTLWANIHIDDREEDSEAKVATFLHLSGDTALSMVIQVPLSRSWGLLCTMILPHRHRIRIITFNPNTREIPARSNPRAPVGFDEDMQQVFRTLWVETLNVPPHVLLAGTVEVSPLWFPPNLVSARWWRFPLNLLMEAPHTFPNLYEISTHLAGLPDFPLRSSKFPVLQYLDIHSDETHSNQTLLLSSLLEQIQLPTLLLLRYHGKFDWIFKCLVDGVARTLQHLELEVSILDAALVLSALKTLRALRQLRLLLLPYNDGSTAGTYSTWSVTQAILGLDVPGQRLTGVHTVALLLKPLKEEDTPVTLDQLWICFLALYPKVSFLVCNVPVRRHNFISAVKTLIHLKSIDFSSVLFIDVPHLETPGTTCRLPKLTEIRTQNVGLAHYLVAPILLHFSMVWSSGGRHLGDQAAGQIRSLVVTVASTTNRNSGENVEFDFNISRYSALESFSITFVGREHRIGAISLPSLKQIKIFVGSPVLSQCNQFCAALLCWPESCPRLEELAFNSFMEWDVLVLMLERRNFLQNKAVSKIRQINLLHITPKVRLMVASLLAGKRIETTVKTLWSLSIAGIESLVLDAKRPGCFCCVQQGLSNCSEPHPIVLKSHRNVQADTPIDSTEGSDQFPFYDWHIPFPRSEQGSPQLSEDKVKWFNTRYLRVQSWINRASSWYRSHSRLLMCATQRCSPAVTVTEYDILPPNALSRDLSQYDTRWETFLRASTSPRGPVDYTHSNMRPLKLRQYDDLWEKFSWPPAASPLVVDGIFTGTRNERYKKRLAQNLKQLEEHLTGVWDFNRLHTRMYVVYSHYEL